METYDKSLEKLPERALEVCGLISETMRRTLPLADMYDSNKVIPLEDHLVRVNMFDRGGMSVTVLREGELPAMTIRQGFTAAPGEASYAVLDHDGARIASFVVDTELNMVLAFPDLKEAMIRLNSAEPHGIDQSYLSVLNSLAGVENKE